MANDADTLTIIENFTTLFNNMEEGVVVHDAQNKVIQYNPAALNILCLSEDQLLGKTSYDPKWKAFNEDMSLCVPEHHPAVVAAKTLQVQKNKILGMSVGRKEIRWLNVTAVPIMQRGELNRIIITFVNITEEIVAKDEVRRKEQALRSMIDALPIMIGQVDRKLIIKNSNHAFNIRFIEAPVISKGLDLRQIPGGKIFFEDLENIEHVLHGQGRLFEKSITNQSGEVKPLLIQFLPDISSTGIEGFYILATDVSDIRRLEEERRLMESRLAHASRMTLMGEMAANIAHEINNPIAAIHIRAEILRNRIERGEFNSESFDVELAKVQDIVERTGRIISAFQSLSRSGDSEPMEKTLVRACIEDAVDIWKQRLENNSIDLHFDSGCEFYINCRRGQIAQVFMNLISNSFVVVSKLSERWIKIDVSSFDSHVRIVFADSGKGIKDDIAERIMEPFFTASESEGTGLGLSICRSIVDAHGGDLRYELSSAGNTSFVITLPSCFDGLDQ